MKRFQFLMGFLCGALLLGGFTSVASAASGIMATISNQAVYVDGQRVTLTAYLIGGSNYVKLRDVGEAVGFNVYWDGAVQIESDKPYTGVAPISQPSQPAQQTTAALTEESVQATIRALRDTYPTNTPMALPTAPPATAPTELLPATARAGRSFAATPPLAISRGGGWTGRAGRRSGPVISLNTLTGRIIIHGELGH